MKKIWLSIALASICFGIEPLEVAQKANDRDDGDKIIANMSMILIDKNNTQRSKDYTRYSIDDGQDQWSMLFFTQPINIKDTAFLSLDYRSDKSDDQWLYLPALQKSKRIANDDKSSSFMGSDFSYSDMTKKNIQEYEYKILKEMKIENNTDVWVLEAIPKDKKTIDETGYTKSILFVRQDNFVLAKAIHYCSDNKTKYYEVEELKTIDNIPTPLKMSMSTKDGQTLLHKTTIIINDIKYNQNIDKSIFSLRSIEKGL